jgi:short subunit dehydrogenase-like uncharacterized protein
VTTASETSDVLLLGAAGNSGRLIAADLAARGLSVRLAGAQRQMSPGPVGDLEAARLASGAANVVAAQVTVDGQPA